MAKPNYIFKFQIVDTETDQTIEADYCTITDANIDGFGGCEVVDHEIARMLRNWRSFARAEYEAENYPTEEDDEE